MDQAKLDKEIEELQAKPKGFGEGVAKLFTAKDLEGLRRFNRKIWRSGKEYEAREQS